MDLSWPHRKKSSEFKSGDRVGQGYGQFRPIPRKQRILKATLCTSSDYNVILIYSMINKNRVNAEGTGTE